MQLSDFSYKLPEELIASYPLANRGDSKLLCLFKNSSLEHKQFKDILALLQQGDCLVLNDTKVNKARLYGKKLTGGKVEILLERCIDNKIALANIAASKAPKNGSEIIIANKYNFTVLGRVGSLFSIRLDDQLIDLSELMELVGEIPLPHYFNRNVEDFDEQRYQTVYAKNSGAVAAPTAGLHFDDNLLTALKDKGIKIVNLTLHVGAGTFQPVRVEEITKHVMHKEWVDIPDEVCATIKETKANNGRVIAVGTTSLRALETAYINSELKPYAGDTDLFIYPGYKFKLVDALITNFHLPKSTLLMLVCALGGFQEVMHAYTQAVKHHYRFYSYGDAMLIERKI